MSLHIRLYQSSDEAAIRRICFETALYGKSIAPLCSDEQFISDIWLLYYLRFELSWLLIAEIDGRVAGYLTGCAQTRRFKIRFALFVLPLLIARFFKTAQWRSQFFKKVAQALKSHATSGARKPDLKPYPAHCHINLDSQFRGQGVGRALLEEFLDRLRKARIPGVHAISGTSGGQALFAKAGFSVRAQYNGFPLEDGPPPQIFVLIRSLL